MKKIIIAAMILYAVLAPFTYHPDTKLTLYYATVGKEKVWDIYKYLNVNKSDVPDFHYPPMNYWLLKAELPMAKLIGGDGLVQWLGVGGNRAFLSDKIYIYNLAVKMPLLILVLIGGYIINLLVLKNGGTKKEANRAALIWLFNPITLYSAVIMGQNDILALVPFLMGLLYFYDKPIASFILFGIAGSIKTYPLIWALLLAFNYPKTGIVKKIILALLPIGIYILPMLPFIRYEYFRTAVIYSGLSERIFAGSIDIGFGDKLLIVPMLLAGLMLVAKRKRLTGKLKSLCLMLMSATILILGFSHFHPQWFIWMMPFAAIYMADKKDWWWYVLLIGGLAGVIMMFADKYLYWGLLTPINNGLINLPFISEILINKGLDVILLNNLCHSVLAGIAVYWFFECATYEDK